MKMSRKTALSCSVAAAALMWCAAASAQIYSFNIPSESAVKAIPELARQAGIQIIAPAEGLEVRTPEIKGSFELHAALSTLLHGTGFVIAAEDGQTIIVAKGKEQPPTDPTRIPSASIKQTVAAERNLTAPLIVAQGQQAAMPPPMLAAEQQLPEQVLVTGSLIHGTAAVGVPVTTFGDADFKETGALTVADVLKELPSVTVLPSVNIFNTGGNVGG